MFPETCLIQDGRMVRKVVGQIDWMGDDIASFVRWRLARRVLAPRSTEKTS
jgi:hypothetical protein